MRGLNCSDLTGKSLVFWIGGSFYMTGGCVVVQFYPWFNFYFPLFQTHNHTLPYPKTKENKN